MRVEKRFVRRCALLAALAGLVLAGPAWAAEAGKSPLKVFILAGQSNMEGHGVVTGKPGQKGTLETLTQDPASAARYKHLLDKDGNWIVRDDVWLSYYSTKCPLTIGKSAARNAIGPELAFGWTVGDYLDEQVLLIKFGPGGTSLAGPWRPPSSGDAGQRKRGPGVGDQYDGMIAGVKKTLENLKADFPEYDGKGYELVGFGWHQGWNDGCSAKDVAEYEKNMVNFIKDVRKDLGVPKLPFVIAGSGFGGWGQKIDRRLGVMAAQKAAAERDQFKGNVQYVETRSFFRDGPVSPRPIRYHWCCNAESYYLIGEGMGKAMIELLGGPKAPPNPTGPANKTNVVLCMTDDQGWGDVSYNGLKKIRTPNLDAMAATGMRFNRFYAQPSCSPARASVMTGRHPNRMGVFWPGMLFRKQEITIAQAVKTAGYATGHFGKWHLNGVAGPGKVMADFNPFAPRSCGFDESFSVSNYFELDWTFGHNGVPEKVTGDGSEAIVAEALKFIGDASEKKKPFLAVVWFGSPHVPHRPLPADLETAGGSGYYGELVAMDRSMGTLRSGLRELGIAENTLVWFCSDNGGWVDPKRPDAHGTNAGLRGRKGQIWEGGIRVPSVIEWPAKIKRPVATEVPAGVIDIYPTLVDILQIKVPHQVRPIDGVSLLPLLEGKMKTRPKPMGFWQYGGNQPRFNTNSGPSAWNDNRYKLVKSAPNKWELYDLTADPSETTDVADKQPEVLNRMKAELEAWQLSVIRSWHGKDYPEGKVVQPEKPKRPKRQ